jgi:DNA-binding GntR family transcriptional regulator
VKPEDRHRLRALVERMRRAAMRGDLHEYRRLHRSYSDLINECHANRWLAELYTLLMRHIQRLETWNFTPRRIHTSIREHEDILTHLLRGDEALAEEAARAHQRSALRDLLLELARHSESPIMALAPTGRPAVVARASGHRQ